MVVQKERGRKERDEMRHKIAQFAPYRPRMCDGKNRVALAALREKGETTDAPWFAEEDPQSARKVAIRADISRRLRRICPHYTDEEFSDLVDSMTQRQIEGERRANRVWE